MNNDNNETIILWIKGLRKAYKGINIGVDS